MRTISKNKDTASRWVGVKSLAPDNLIPSALEQITTNPNKTTPIKITIGAKRGMAEGEKTIYSRLSFEISGPQPTAYLDSENGPMAQVEKDTDKFYPIVPLIFRNKELEVKRDIYVKFLPNPGLPSTVPVNFEVNAGIPEKIVIESNSKDNTRSINLVFGSKLSRLLDVQSWLGHDTSGKMVRLFLDAGQSGSRRIILFRKIGSEITDDEITKMIYFPCDMRQERLCYITINNPTRAREMVYNENNLIAGKDYNYRFYAIYNEGAGRLSNNITDVRVYNSYKLKTSGIVLRRDKSSGVQTTGKSVVSAESLGQLGFDSVKINIDMDKIKISPNVQGIFVNRNLSTCAETIKLSSQKTIATCDLFFDISPEVSDGDYYINLKHSGDNALPSYDSVSFINLKISSSMLSQEPKIIYSSVSKSGNNLKINIQITNPIVLGGQLTAFYWKVGSKDMNKIADDLNIETREINWNYSNLPNGSYNIRVCRKYPKYSDYVDICSNIYKFVK